MNDLCLALIGCGVMGRELAEQAITLEGASLVAVSDVDEAGANKLAEDFSATAYTAYDTMLQTAKPDAVFIATPPFLHREMTEAAADAGCHVFCEKPMAVALEDCDAMIAACERAGVTLMIGQVCRYHGVHRKVRDLVAGGELGRPICMHVHRVGGPWRSSGVWNRPWRLELAKNGGLLMEINAHEIDWMRFVCGEVSSVFARGGTYVQPEADYPDNIIVSMQFADGAIGSLHGSQSSAVGSYGGRVDCTEGGLSFPKIWGEGAGITVGRFVGAEAFIPADGLAAENPVRRELREFCESIHEGRPPEISGGDGRAVIEIATAAYASIQTGQAVSLPL